MGGNSIESERLLQLTDKVEEEALVTSFSNSQFAFLGSTISQSDQELKLSPLLAEYPRLPPADATSSVQFSQNEMIKISITILKAWGKALGEAADLMKRVIDSPEAKVEFDLIDRYEWLNSLAGLVSALIHMSTKGSQGVSQMHDNSATLVPQFLLLALADSALFQGGALVGAASVIDGFYAESKVIQGAWGAITHQAQDHPTVIAGWLSSLWGIGLIYQLSADHKKIDGVKKEKGKPADINFAKTYAETILGVVSSGQFSTSIEAALASATGQSTESGADPNSLVKKAKLALLSIALALLLKLEEGTTSELSFSGLLKGEVDLTKNDPYDTASLKRALLDEIQLILAALEPDERDQILYSLLGYMSTNPAVEEMLDQQKVFKNVLNSTTFENELVDKRPLGV